MKSIKLLSALVLVAGLVLPAAGAAAQDKIKIILGNAASPPHPFYQAGLMWKEEVERLTDGRVEVDYLHSRQLGEDRQLIEGTMSGTIDATVFSTISLTVLAKKASFEALQLPFLISSYESLAEVLSSDAAQALLADLDDVNLVGVSLFEGGRRHFLTRDKPVRTIEDFRGVKTRVIGVPLHLEIWETAGAAPVGMNYGEIYTSLETGVIDGVEINVSSVESEKLWEPAKHFTFTGHYFWTGGIIYNKANFDALPEDIQAAILEAGRSIIVPQVMATRDAEAGQIEELKELGVQFYEFEELDEMRALMEPIIADRVAKNETVATFVEGVREIEAKHR
jgi:tripartite ATP-independent transporter DctP family solute receptor